MILNSSLKYAKRQQFIGLGFHIFLMRVACSPWAAFGLFEILLRVVRAPFGNLLKKSKVQINPLKKRVCSISYTSSACKGRRTFLAIVG